MPPPVQHSKQSRHRDSHSASYPAGYQGSSGGDAYYRASRRTTDPTTENVPPDRDPWDRQPQPPDRDPWYNLPQSPDSDSRSNKHQPLDRQLYGNRSLNQPDRMPPPRYDANEYDKRSAGGFDSEGLSSSYSTSRTRSSTIATSISSQYAESQGQQAGYTSTQQYYPGYSNTSGAHTYGTAYSYAPQPSPYQYAPQKTQSQAYQVPPMSPTSPRDATGYTMSPTSPRNATGYAPTAGQYAQESSRGYGYGIPNQQNTTMERDPMDQLASGVNGMYIGDGRREHDRANSRRVRQGEHRQTQDDRPSHSQSLTSYSQKIGLDSTDGAERREKPLDPRYRVQPNPNKFFVFGRVFQVLWSQPRGVNATVVTKHPTSNNGITKGKHNEDIYSSIRRMVCIIPRKGCAWCMPICTYQGQGVWKKGIDRESHAIIHMKDSPPVFEQKLPKDIIPHFLTIEPATPGDTLEATSCLDFGRIYTVEYNHKVKPVGHMSEESMAVIQKYWERATKQGKKLTKSTLTIEE